MTEAVALDSSSKFMARDSRSVGLVYSAFGFSFEVKQRRARLVGLLGRVTARVLDREACPTRWTGCQVGQVVRLLGLGTVVAKWAADHSHQACQLG